MDLTVSLRSVRGERAGLSKLIMDFRFKCNSDGIYSFFSLNAEVRAANTQLFNDFTQPPSFLGHAVSETDRVCQFTRGYEDTFTLGISLTPYQLQKLEEARKGGDLFLFLRFLGLAAQIEGSPTAGLARFIVPSIRAESSSGPYNPFKIAQSDWVKVLKELGYGDYFLIEIPLRGVPGQRGMEKAVTHLVAARDHFAEGKDAEVLFSCYKAFEFLAKRVGAQGPDQNAFEKLLAHIEDADKRKSLKMLMDYVCRFYHLGRHESGISRSQVSHEDSEYGLILAQATLRYLAYVATKSS